jgi:hypothetical protein
MCVGLFIYNHGSPAGRQTWMGNVGAIKRDGICCVPRRWKWRQLKATDSPSHYEMLQSQMLFTVQSSESTNTRYTKITAFWDVISCGFIDNYRRFGRTFCLYHLHSLYPEDGSSRFIGTLSIVRILNNWKKKHDVSETGSVSVLRCRETPTLLGPPPPLSQRLICLVGSMGTRVDAAKFQVGSPRASSV